jgi:hypothetical protein
MAVMRGRALCLAADSDTRSPKGEAVGARPTAENISVRRVETEILRTGDRNVKQRNR